VLALAPSFQGTALAGTYSNGFESPSGWVFWGEGNQSGAIYGEVMDGYAHGGSALAGLYASNGGFSTVGRSVYLPYGGIGPTQYCTAGFWVQANSTAQVQVEVINPANWTYISYKSYTVSGSALGAYTWVSTFFTRPSSSSRNAFVRFLTQADIAVDDLKVTCQGCCE
jgi:hypothetical protein